MQHTAGARHNLYCAVEFVSVIASVVFIYYRGQESICRVHLCEHDRGIKCRCVRTMLITLYHMHHLLFSSLVPSLQSPHGEGSGDIGTVSWL